MSHPPVSSGRQGKLILLAVIAAVAGLVLIVVAVAAQKSAPQPPRSAGSINSDGPSASGTSSLGTTASGAAKAPLKASLPVSISIPSIGVKSAVLPIGKAKDGTLAVPQPGPDLNKAAWYKNSPTPGQPGPSIIEGHVDSQSGPSVFFELGKLRPGNKISVTRADGVVAEFTVNAVRDYQKSKFPTAVVYGAKDLSKPQLRLITCSDFDPSIRHHTGNEVVFAHLTGTHRAR